jgi:CDP-glucose 4,6-dehydratase
MSSHPFNFSPTQPFHGVFRGKKVFVTGHTGFKGSWLAQWLLELGATVHGYALIPETTPSLFDQLGLAHRLEHEIADIRDAETVKKSLLNFQPDFVFHLAAQPLVRRSYQIPVETYETNVNGTIHVLEALRALSNPCSAVIVTTDKCYENHESGRAYEETDPLGGHDPYSSSKAMAEIVTAAYRSSYFQDHPVCIATARAGNVIGGGDWAEDRIVPDAMRALNQGMQISVRNPFAVRPWQHVLEPLGGYLTLASALSLPTTDNQQLATSSLCSAYNFGPGPDSNRTVADLVKEILKHHSGAWQDASDPTALHEASLLNLSIEKADRLLNWQPKWKFEETIQKTVFWYDAVSSQEATPLELTNRQIAEYQQACS